MRKDDYYKFVEYIQKFKMIELWDNEIDEIWDKI